MISRKFSAWRSRSSDSRPVIRLPRSTAARRRAEAAKNADHSVSSGATRGSSSHTLRGRERVVLARMARPAPDAPAPDDPASDRPAPPPRRTTGPAGAPGSGRPGTARDAAGREQRGRRPECAEMGLDVTLAGVTGATGLQQAGPGPVEQVRGRSRRAEPADARYPGRRRALVGASSVYSSAYSSTLLSPPRAQGASRRRDPRPRRW